MCSCGTLHDTPANYYVSVLNDSRVGLLAGPFKTHEEALRMVSQAREVAEKLDPFAHFYSFGTLATKPTYTKPGVLNARLHVGG